MNITSVEFVKGVVGSDKVLEDGLPQIAFIGRSNVGKSSVINSLAGQKNVARTSSAAGRTTEINLFLINRTFYLVDLPGYGFAQASWEDRDRLQQLIYWYLLDSHYEQKKVVLIIDANVGATADDLRMLHSLQERKKNIVIVANKVDKVKKSGWSNQLRKIQGLVGDFKVIPYSAEKKIGVSDLISEVFE